MAPWSRRQLLGSLVATSLVPAQARAATADRNLVLVVAAGGWDVSFALDPKPEAIAVDGPDDGTGGGTETLGRWGELEVALNDLRRPAVRSFFDRWSDRTAVINGVSTGTLSHERSLSRVLSGTWDARWPDLAAAVGATDTRRPLGAVDLSGLARFGPHAGRCARWGRQGQARALLDPEAHFARPDSPDGLPWFDPEQGERQAVDLWLQDRAARLSDRWPDARGRVREWLDAMDRAVDLRDRRFPIGRGLPWGWAASHQGDVDLVVELLGREVCRSVVVSTRQQWDTHARFDVQHTSWNQTFLALDQLLTRLEETDQLDRTTVLVVSEMSRTPLRNEHGGKDHWPWTSFLVAGAGVRGGVRLGGTDEGLRGLSVDPGAGRPDPGGHPLEPASVLAGVAELVGVDPGSIFPKTPVCRGFFG